MSKKRNHGPQMKSPNNLKEPARRGRRVRERRVAAETLAVEILHWKGFVEERLVAFAMRNVNLHIVVLKPAEPRNRVGGAQLANNWSRSPKDLNSRALPEGSRKNIVDCSPGSPSKRV